jgi:uncharacterized protein YndB with AHSA1/START domain
MVTVERHKMETVASITVDKPVEVVWKAFTDNTIMSNVSGFPSKQTSVGPFGLGTTFRETRPKMPKTQDFRVIACETNQKLGLEIFSGPIRGSRITYSLENIEGKTRVTETADFHVAGITRLLVPLIDRPGKAEKEATDRLVNIKHAVETGAQP